MRAPPAWAPSCGIYNPQEVLEINFYCDTYGLDTISYGTMTAFLMECYERGILNEERTGGLKLEWGNAAADLEMMHQMARERGLRQDCGPGHPQAEGVLRGTGLGRHQRDERLRHGAEGPGVL